MYFPHVQINYKQAIYFTLILISTTFSLNIKYSALADTVDTIEEEEALLEERKEKLRQREERIEQLEQQARELELQQEIIRTKKAIAESELGRVRAKRQAAEAYLPTIDTSEAPQGKLSTEGLTFENEVLAFRAMDSVAKKIQDEIVDKLGSRVSLIVSDQRGLSSNIFGQLKYRAFKDKVDTIKKNYRNLNVRIFKRKLSFTPPPGGRRRVGDIEGASRSEGSGYGRSRGRVLDDSPRGRGSIINPATAAAGSFLFELLPVFRMNRTIKEKSVGITTRDFIAQLGGKFRESDKSKVSIYYPAEYPLMNKDAVNDVLKEINTIKKLQNIAEKNILSSPNSTNSNKLKTLNQSVEEFLEQLTLTDYKSNDEIASAQKGKSIQTSRISQKSLLQEIISSRAFELITGADSKTYFLSVELFAKGTQRTTKTFLSNRLRHSGGVIVKYIIYDQNASIVLSNVHHSYTGFTRVRTSE